MQIDVLEFGIFNEITVVFSYYKMAQGKIARFLLNS